MKESLGDISDYFFPQNIPQRSSVYVHITVTASEDDKHSVIFGLANEDELNSLEQNDGNIHTSSSWLRSSPPFYCKQYLL